MTRRISMLAAVFACVALAQAAVAGGLTDLLMSQVGVTQPQAVGGSGAIFKLAQAQMTKGKFGLLKAAIPGMDKYLAAAPRLGAPPTTPSTPAATEGMSELANQALQMAGGTQLGGKLQALQQLAPAFEKLGLKPKMITKFMPVVVNYLQGSGSSGAASLLTSALGF